MASAEDKALVAETIAAAPPVEAVVPAAAVVPATGPTPTPMFDTTATQRHGRTAAKLLGLCSKNLADKPLDQELQETTGDVLGEAFGLLSMMTTRLVYVGALVGIVAVPAALVGWKWWRDAAAKDVTPKGGSNGSS